jgi:hypothetical protein
VAAGRRSRRGYRKNIGIRRGEDKRKAASVPGIHELGGKARIVAQAEPKLWAVERNRGLDKAIKSGFSFRYLGLRVAPAEPRVNPGPVKIDEKCYSADTGSADGR